MSGKPEKGRRPVPVARKPAGGGRKPGNPADAAFNEWLHRGLHQMYDDVTSEPMPDELIRLIEQDRRK